MITPKWGGTMRCLRKINDETCDLWRAVDQEGNALHVLVQSRRNAAAAKRLLRKLMRKLQCVPHVLITDRLKNYGVAHRELMPSVEHRQSKYLNNRAESSHQPTRQRERAMPRFKSLGSARALPLRLQHDLTSHPATAASPWAAAYRQEMRTRLHTWREVTHCAGRLLRPSGKRLR